MKNTTRWMLVGLIALAGAAGASPVTPVWSRTAAYSTYQAWDQFTDPPGPRGANLPNSPGPGANPFGPFVDAAPHNTNGSATLRDTGTKSFITGTQNIYSPDEALHVQVAVPHFDLGPGYVTTILLQTRTLGSEIAYGGIRLVYDDSTGTHTLAPVPGAGKELHREGSGSDRGGDLVDYGTLFNLPGSPASFRVEFDGASSSMSMDVASVDSIVTRATAGSPLLPGMNETIGYVPQAVPEPGSVGLISLAAVAKMLARRRRGGRS